MRGEGKELAGVWWSDGRNKVRPLKSSQRLERRPHYSILNMISIFAWSLPLAPSWSDSSSISWGWVNAWLNWSYHQTFTKPSGAFSVPRWTMNDDRTRSSLSCMSCMGWNRGWNCWGRELTSLAQPIASRLIWMSMSCSSWELHKNTGRGRWR